MEIRKKSPAVARNHSLVQTRNGIRTNVAVPQRPVRKTAFGAVMVVDGGRLDPRSSGAGPYLPLDKFRRGPPPPPPGPWFATLLKGSQSAPVSNYSSLGLSSYQLFLVFVYFNVPQR